MSIQNFLRNPKIILRTPCGEFKSTKKVPEECVVLYHDSCMLAKLADNVQKKYNRHAGDRISQGRRFFGRVTNVVIFSGI